MLETYSQIDSSYETYTMKDKLIKTFKKNFENYKNDDTIFKICLKNTIICFLLYSII